jgi:hypothetical protein
MKDPILIRPGTHGRAIWWIPGNPRPNPEAIDKKATFMNAQLNRIKPRGFNLSFDFDDRIRTAHQQLDEECNLAMSKETRSR